MTSQNMVRALVDAVVVSAAASVAGQRGPVVIGPPAPVPAQVAMLRPSADELAQMNGELKKFIDANKTPSREMLRKYESLLLLQAPRLNTAATFTRTAQRMGPSYDIWGVAVQATLVKLLK